MLGFCYCFGRRSFYETLEGSGLGREVTEPAWPLEPTQTGHPQSFMLCHSEDPTLMLEPRSCAKSPCQPPEGREQTGDVGVWALSAPPPPPLSVHCFTDTGHLLLGQSGNFSCSWTCPRDRERGAGPGAQLPPSCPGHQGGRSQPCQALFRHLALTEPFAGTMLNTVTGEDCSWPLGTGRKLGSEG